jgi:tRNA(His) guanylyltransferase
MSNTKDSLGDRVKRYESVSKPLLMRRTPLFIRVDGKAFHTFTRGCKKPFDQDIIDCMVYATEMTAKNMQGFKLAYTQSDEATFMLMDNDTLETDAWFDYELNKIVSITASMFTAFFNEKWFELNAQSELDARHSVRQANKRRLKAFFDARAFNVPEEDWPNVFIWRQRDWVRNSIQMVARSLYSQKQLEGKKTADLHELLYQKDVNWADLMPQYKNGTFVLWDGSKWHDFVGYEDCKKLIK